MNSVESNLERKKGVAFSCLNKRKTFALAFPSACNQTSSRPQLTRYTQRKPKRSEPKASKVSNSFTQSTHHPIFFSLILLLSRSPTQLLLIIFWFLIRFFSLCGKSQWDDLLPSTQTLGCMTKQENGVRALAKSVCVQILLIEFIWLRDPSGRHHSFPPPSPNH